MKKQNFCLAIALLALISGILFYYAKFREIPKDENVWLTVNGEKIFVDDVEKTVERKIKNLETEKPQHSISTDTLDRSAITAMIIDAKIRHLTAITEARKLGIEASHEEAVEEAMKNYDMAKQLMPAEELAEYINSLGFTEDEYIEQMCRTYRDMITTANLRAWYDENICETPWSDDEAYEKYIDTLVDKAKIVYLR